MELNYYKQYYDMERQHWWFIARERIICEHITKLKNEQLQGRALRILNIGCGTGRSTEYLMQFGEVVSLEYDQFCCQYTRDRTGLDIINGSITELPFETKSFDLVVAYDVIEHVEDDNLAMREMKRVCNDGGIVMVTVPAFMSLWGQHDVINHHYRRYQVNRIKELFITQGDQGKLLFSSYFNTYLFLPILAVRKLTNLWHKISPPKEKKSDFDSVQTGFINNWLEKLMHSENGRMLKGKSWPFGVSIIGYWHKKV